MYGTIGRVQFRAAGIRWRQVVLGVRVKQRVDGEHGGGVCPSTQSCPADAWKWVFITLSPCFRPLAGEGRGHGNEEEAGEGRQWAG